MKAFRACCGLAFSSLAIFSCGSSATEEPAAPTPTQPAEGRVPAGCDATADIKDAPACVVSSFGVFVDRVLGDDAGPGTKEAPLKTIGAAIEKRGAKPRIYVCEGTYPERVKVTSAVSIFGGFACGSWAYGGIPAVVAPLEKGYALEVRGLTTPVVVADLAFTARDALDPGESSVAVFVASSTRVLLRRITATAGRGAPGADGEDKDPFFPSRAESLDEKNYSQAQPNLRCPSSVGGAGGTQAIPNGGTGLPMIAPAYPIGSTGQGGAVGGQCGGSDGSFGLGGESGLGASGAGSLTAAGWRPRDGSAGFDGGHGQGGGGGSNSVNNFGGVGTSGGCGGDGGAKGGGGGGSVAVAVFQSVVELAGAALLSNEGGRGGRGGRGQIAQLYVAKRYVGSPDIKYCVGGIGGAGGSGGGGGGGAGGVSAGVLYLGPPPAFDGALTAAAATFPRVTLGAPGAGGEKGPGGLAADPSPPNPTRAGADGTNGVPGEAKAVMAAP